MPTKPKSAAVPRKSKGKRHPIHASSLDHMARQLQVNPTYSFMTRGDRDCLARLFRGEAKRVRSIVR